MHNRRDLSIELRASEDELFLVLIGAPSIEDCPYPRVARAACDTLERDGMMILRVLDDEGVADRAPVQGPVAVAQRLHVTLRPRGRDVVLELHDALDNYEGDMVMVRQPAHLDEIAGR